MQSSSRPWNFCYASFLFLSVRKYQCVARFREEIRVYLCTSYAQPVKTTYGSMATSLKSPLDLFLDEALNLRCVEQNAFSKLLWWLAIADGAEVQDL